MKLYFENTNFLKAIIYIINDVIDISTWHFYPDKIVIQNISGDSSFIHSITIDSSDCQYYNSEDYIYLTFSCSSILNIINGIQNNSSVKIIYDDYTDYLLFNFKEDYISINFELKLENKIENLFNFPKYCPDCIVTLKSEDFKKIIDELIKVDNRCKITVNKLNITFESNGKIGNYSFTISNLNGCFIEYKKDVISAYCNDYMIDCYGMNKLSEYVKIYIINNFPIKLVYSIGNNSFIEYFISPL